MNDGGKKDILQAATEAFDFSHSWSLIVYIETLLSLQQKADLS